MKRLLVIAFFLVAVSCGSNGDYIDLGATPEGQPMAKNVAAPRQATPSADEMVKKVIKTGSIRFQSADIQEDYERVTKIIRSYDAYVEDENQYNNEQEVEYSLVIRVASEVFDSLYQEVAGLGEKLDHRSVQARDVTEQYYDLQSRIRNKKALEVSYLELLSKANKVADILEIERSLNEVRTEIEQLEGQFQYLSRQVSYSTINLSFYERLPYTHSVVHRTGFAARISNALYNGWYGFLSFLVWVFSLWPFILLAPLVIYGFRKAKRRWRGVKK